MKCNSNSKNWPLGVFLWVLFILNSSGCSTIFNTDRVIPNADQPVVEQVPPGTFDRQIVAPYQGLHPRLVTRPDDPYSYPIQLGAIGPVEPYFSGPLHYPFLCQTQESGLGQPLVDNDNGIGVPIYAVVDGEVTQTKIGYSKDCSIKTAAAYFYNKKDSKEFLPYTDSISMDDITQVEVNGQTLPFILRVEWGTINRYIYSLYALKSPNETLESPNSEAWNQRLILAFRGGVGIGFKQGKNRPLSIIDDRYKQLAQGYGLVYSSGLQTSNHYNIWESEEIALRLKHQFTALYGEPLYTVGVGGSGGGLSQYLLAQNRPGILDAAIPQYSYPDMVSQTIYALDCDLLERYFDLDDRSNNFWEKWENRTMVQGLSARSVDEHEYAKIYQLSKLVNGFFPTRPRGVSECVLGWRGAAQVAHNPKYTHYYYRYAKNIVNNNHWTHWENLRSLYGTDEHGFAHSLWDNEGVQYGLKALLDGEINFHDFIDINRQVGSWRPQHEMRVARFWKFSGERDPLAELNIWSTQNMRKGSTKAPAPRGQANSAAIEAAFRSGMVFTGVADLPIIDVRHYMDDIQDMHHSFASFTTRKRMLKAVGQADNHIIWMARREYNPTDLAFEVMDEWMLNLLGDKSAGEDRAAAIVAAQPQQAQDACFDETGAILHQGKEVWDGAWNEKSTGPCLALMPNYSSPRQVAGGDIVDITFKCDRVSVENAVASGLYGTIESGSEEAIRLLNKTFPTGVCDYNKPGIGTLSAQELGLVE